MRGRRNLLRIFALALLVLAPAIANGHGTTATYYRETLAALRELGRDDIPGDFVRLTVTSSDGVAISVSVMEDPSGDFLHWSEAVPRPYPGGKPAFTESGAKAIFEGEKALIEANVLNSTFFSREPAVDEDCFHGRPYWLEARIEGNYNLVSSACDSGAAGADAASTLVKEVIRNFGAGKFHGIPFPGFPAPGPQAVEQ